MKKKILVSLLIAFSISVTAEIIAWAVDSSHKTLIMPSDAVLLFPGDAYANGYNVEGNVFTPINNDPQIGCTMPGQKLKNVIITFERPISNDIAIELYYASDNEELTEEKRINTTVRKGSTYAVIAVPDNEYTHIRTDINGPFSLSGISISESEPSFRAEGIYLDYTRITVSGILFFIIFMAAVAFRERKNINFYEPYFSGLYQYRVIILIGVFLLLVVLQVNNSSMMGYASVMPNNIKQAGMFSLGKARLIRTDEFVVSLARSLHDNTVGSFSSLWENRDSIVTILDNLIKIANPYNWGEYFLPGSYALSWTFVVGHVISLFALYKLFHIISNHKRFSLIAALILVWSPASQWWSSNQKYGWYCGVIVLFYEFFEVETAWKKVLCAFGIVCLTSILVTKIYPAWDIPLAYLYTFVLVGIYATKRKINFHKRDVPYIIVTIAMMLIIVAAYFTSGSDKEAMLATVYPGQRFSTGGNLSLNGFFGNYLLMPFTPWKGLTFSGTNLSEISSHIHLFPIPFVIYILKYKEIKHCKVVTGLFVFCMLCKIYMLIGIPAVIAKYTLLSYTTSDRLATIWGFASCVLLLLECFYIVPSTVEQIRKTGYMQVIEFGILNISIVAFLIWVVRKHPEYVTYMGELKFSYLVLGLVLVGNLLFWGKKREFLFILLLITVVSGATVNPINSGISVMDSTPLAVEIRHVDRTDPGRWISLDNYISPKYVYAQGVDCINWLSWPPRFDLFEPLDESGEYRDIYNRYAHVIVRFTEDDTTFKLNQGDLFTVFLNLEDLQKWDVKYVVNQGYSLEDTDRVKFTPLYHDLLDDYNIYKVTYS